MDRTNAEASVGGLFTDGDPGLGVAATVVDARILNLIQEELVNAVEAAGLTLSDADDTQLSQAIALIIEKGSPESQRGSESLTNNQASATNIVGLFFDNTKTKSANFTIDVFRRDDSQSANEVFDCSAIYDPEAGVWSISHSSRGDDSGVTLSIDTATGQVKYQTTNYAGASYSGIARYSNVRKVDITL